MHKKMRLPKKNVINAARRGTKHRIAGKGESQSAFKGKCNNCGKYGHMVWDCW